MKWDFSGWATRNDVRCSDGRTIKRDAFKECDGKVVPLVWDHRHEGPENVLGHALLQNRPEGVYTYGAFNNSNKGLTAKELVRNGDITSLSIFANHLRQNGGDVVHGAIREVSLVLAGANPEAFIDSVMIHGDDEDECAIIYTGNFELEKENKEMLDYINHADDGAESKPAKEPEKEPAKEGGKEKTVGEVFATFTEEQKQVVYALVGAAVEKAKQEKNDNTGDENMKHNVFDNESENERNTLSHSDIEAIFSDAKRCGSMKEATLAHGIDNIEYLFPDDHNLDTTPQWIKRDDSWVSTVMNGVHHTPFSRIKSQYADLTEDEARAKGYIKGNMKKEQFFAVAKRSTAPTTVYKKQKLDRDDVIDITDFDVVAWIKSEMRGMLNEELARAFLVSDGRDPSSDDKINEQNIRPIWTDDDIFSVKKLITVAANATDDQKAKQFIRTVIKSHKDYKGSGNPILYTTEDVLTDCLLMEDNMGRVVYDTKEKLATTLRVKSIVTVPVMENLTREVSGVERNLVAIMVNLNDYTVGADKGGAVSMFDDFDIDYNAQKYLIETRCSGALTKPYSAVVFETVTSGT